MGGGTKAGANTWRALRDIKTRDHRAWLHLADSALTEEDLPRGIDLGDVRFKGQQAASHAGPSQPAEHATGLHAEEEVLTAV